MYFLLFLDVIPHVEFWTLVASKSVDFVATTSNIVASKVGVAKPDLSGLSRKTEYEDFGL